MLLMLCSIVTTLASMLLLLLCDSSNSFHLPDALRSPLLSPPKKDAISIYQPKSNQISHHNHIIYPFLFQIDLIIRSDNTKAGVNPATVVNQYVYYYYTNELWNRLCRVTRLHFLAAKLLIRSPYETF